MDDLLAARSQMAMSLAFHMIFAVFGMGLPVLVVIAEGLWLRTGDPGWKLLAQRQAKGTAILFAVGAVSGTVLSFELGLLWPRFMEAAGPVIGMPFSLEGFAFFFEAIFLGIWLYGWHRVGRIPHFLAGIGVAVSGAASGAFVVCANAWMNTPTGFRVAADGSFVDIDPFGAMFNPSSFGQALHMLVAAWLATGFAAAGVHAAGLLRARGPADITFHRRGIAIGLVVGGIAAFAQPLTGHVVGEAVAHWQPVKLAALEGHWETTAGAGLTIGGWVDGDAETTTYGVEVPYLLSILATGDPQGVVRGLKDFPREDRPPVGLTHWAYQIMLATAGVSVGTTVLATGLAIRRRGLPVDRWFLRWLVVTAPAGMIGIEAGWTATEVGRQPWVVQGYIRTADAVTPMPGLWAPFLVFTLLYLFLGVVTVSLLNRQFRYGPVEPPGEHA